MQARRAKAWIQKQGEYSWSTIFLEQAAHRTEVATRNAAFRVGAQGAAQVVKVVDKQMHANHLIELRRLAAQAQRLHGFAMKARDGARLVVHMVIDQRDLCRFGVIAEQLQVNVRQARGRAVPHRARQVGPKGRHALHPDQGQLPQGLELARLGVGAKERNVLAHRILHLVVIRQRCAGGQAHLAQRPALGRTPLQPFLHHQPGGGLGNFFAQRCVHGGKKGLITSFQRTPRIVAPSARRIRVDPRARQAFSLTTALITIFFIAFCACPISARGRFGP